MTRRAANTKPLTLRKLQGPTLKPNSLPNFDYILLSHDHHFDNLDHAGRVLIAQAKKVLTTEEGTKRLGGNAVGLAHWQATQLIAPLDTLYASWLLRRAMDHPGLTGVR